MKKIYILTIAVLAFTVSNAQIHKGSILLGGGISVYDNKSESPSNQSDQKGFTISPSIGYAFKNNNVLGLQLSYGNDNNKNGNSEQDVNRYGLGFFYRRYMDLNSKFYLFGEGNLNYGYSKDEQIFSSAFSTVYKEDRISLNVFPGIAYAATKRLHLEASLHNLLSLGYTEAKTLNNNSGVITKSESKSFSFSTNASGNIPLSIGFRFVLGK